jgi:hypothetical protein
VAGGGVVGFPGERRPDVVGHRSFLVLGRDAFGRPRRRGSPAAALADQRPDHHGAVGVAERASFEVAGETLDAEPGVEGEPPEVLFPGQREREGQIGRPREDA